MCERNHSGLFFTCALVEQLGRDLKMKRCDVVKALGVNGVQMILGHAVVFHCEPIEKVSDDMQRHFDLPHGQFDNVSAARYAVPGWRILRRRGICWTRWPPTRRAAWVWPPT